VTPAELMTLVAVATLGHVMALFWCHAVNRQWRISRRVIYDLPINPQQLRREIRNSLHAPIHAVILALFLYLGCFGARSIASFVGTLVLAAVWAEIWHYSSHRAFHLNALHWIHSEHHRSRLNTPFTAISFSFSEKLIFDLGHLGVLALFSLLVSLNFFAIATWYILHLIINSFSHANFEMKSARYNRSLGKILTTTTYHSLHHARYTGNHGLGTRVFDRLFGTEWDDYEPLYDNITHDKPLTGLREMVGGNKTA